MSDQEYDLTPAERDALERLPRERIPPAHLEERVVGALQSEGLLHGPAAVEGADDRFRGPGKDRPDGPTGRPAAPRRSHFLPWRARSGWAVAAAAAGLALFAGGTVVGQRMAVRDAGAAMAAALGDDPASRAARVQETGSAYVRAVAGLTDAGADGGDAAALEAATVALHAAALELARVSPDDTTIRLVLAVLEERLGTAGDEAAAEPRTTFWF